MLSKNSEQTILEKIKLQKTDAVEFTKIQSEIEQIHQLNNQLENKQRIPETKTLEDQISEHLQTGISDLEKGNKKRAINENIKEINVIRLNMNKMVTIIK